MKSNYKLGTFAGISVYLHWSFLVFAVGMFVLFLMQGASLMGAALGIGLLSAVFGFVVLHEYGHALTARLFKIPTQDITLYPIGGVARLREMPRNPWQELWIAIAGPAVNVVLAMIFFTLIVMTDSSWMPVDIFSIATIDNPLDSVLSSLLYVNIALVLFNMLPAFPMDGGRVLRSMLALAMNYEKATRIASRVGQGMAILFGIAGLIWFNPFLILIAFFVYMGASQEARMVAHESKMRNSFGDSFEPPMSSGDRIDRPGMILYHDPVQGKKIIYMDYKPE